MQLIKTTNLYMGKCNIPVSDLHKCISQAVHAAVAKKLNYFHNKF